MQNGNTFRGGKIHVCAAMCATCIFRPGNLMRLEPGRVRELVDGATANDTAIICHSTLEGDNAVCRGFYDSHKTTPLLVATAMGLIQEVTP